MYLKRNFSQAVSHLQKWNFSNLCGTFGIFRQFFQVLLLLQKKKKNRGRIKFHYSQQFQYVIIAIIFLHVAFLFGSSGFLFALVLTVFLVININTCNGNKNSKTLFLLPPTKYGQQHVYIAFYFFQVVTLNLIQDPSNVLVTVFQIVIGIQIVYLHIIIQK